MKTRSIASLIALGVIGLAPNLVAEKKSSQGSARRSPPPHQRPDKRTGQHPEALQRPNAAEHERVLLLRRLIDMPPERLAMLQATINRIQNLSAEEKAGLRKRLDNFSRMPSHERRKLLEGFRDDERKRLDAFRHRHKHLPPEQRNHELRRIHSLPPHERRAYFDQLRRGKRPKNGSSPHPRPSPHGENPPPPHPPQR